jgi:hypothetical protein
MTAVTPEWTSAADALARAFAMSGDEWEAIKELRSLTKAGALAARGIVAGQIEQLGMSFWTRYADDHFVEDWTSGRFQGRIPTMKSEAGLQFASRKVAGASRVEFKTADLDEHFPKLPAKRKANGRPPANWWPYVAEELAVWEHEDGLPRLPGHVIQGLMDRLAERGVDPLPARSTLQPVVEAILNRLTSG